jgi:hypothetical protein
MIGLATNIVWQGIMVIIPIMLGLVASVQQALNPTITLVLATGWTGTSILAVRTINEYRKRSSDKIVNVASIMFLSDITISKLLPNELRIAHEEDIRKEITNLLNKMCQLLAYRIPDADKAAIFIILQERIEKTSFSLFTHHNHDSDYIYHTIENILDEESMAAKVAKDGKCRIVHDSNNPGKEVPWKETPNPSRYRGRALAPVQVPVKRVPKVIGVICFDTKVPWTLSESDQKLMLIFADKIGRLWLLTQENSLEYGTTPRRQNYG